MLSSENQQWAGRYTPPSHIVILVRTIPHRVPTIFASLLHFVSHSNNYKQRVASWLYHASYGPTPTHVLVIVGTFVYHMSCSNNLRHRVAVSFVSRCGPRSPQFPVTYPPGTCELLNPWVSVRFSHTTPASISRHSTRVLHPPHPRASHFASSYILVPLTSTIYESCLFLQR